MHRMQCVVRYRQAVASNLFFVAALAAFFCASPKSAAVQASPWPIQAKQPDGTPITIYMRGDEYLHWQEDAEGFAVVESNKWFRYADSVVNGELHASTHAVGKVSPKAVGLLKGLKPAPMSLRSGGDQVVGARVDRAAPNSRVAPTGTIKNLVILMRFANHTARPLPSNSDMDTLFNAVGGDPTLAPTGSVRDVYYENSYGQLTLDSTVVGWVDLPQPEQFYANNVSGLDFYVHFAILHALAAADPLIDFSQYDQDADGFVDSIAFVHSGYAAEYGGTDAYGTPYNQRIWSHRWSIGAWTSTEGTKVSPYHINPGVWGTSGSSIGRIGVICHETGHFFGLPDLYDTDNSPGEGVGSWCLMANSWGFDGTQYHPPHMSAWSKQRLGWMTPTVVTTPGNYSLPQWETNASALRIDQGYGSGEYLLIENRQPVGIESDIPQGGLVVYHVDENVGHNSEGYPGQDTWPHNGLHYQLAVIQADGQYHLERGHNRGDGGDTFHAGGVNQITPTTFPSTDTYLAGKVRYSGNAITNIGASSANMPFTISFGDPLRVDTAAPMWSIFHSLGPEGGPFIPETRVYTLQNSLPADPIVANITATAPWLDASVASRTLAPGASANVTLSLASEASLLPVGDYTATAKFTNTTTGFSHDIDARLNISSIIANFPMNTDPGWQRENQWEFGTPQGLAGDPTSGKTGTNVFGYNLSGVYPNNMSTYYLTTNAIDCSAYSTVILRYWRWLGVEAFALDNAGVMVSTDGINYNSVWFHTGPTVQDTAWSEQVFDITQFAAGQPTVYIRWHMGPTDSYVNYSGWNIDDVMLTGTPSNLQNIVRWNFATDPGWTAEGDWQRGTPTGNNSDPTSGHGDPFVYGYNLNGTYTENMPAQYLTSTPINCSNYSNVQLSYWRWLVVEGAIYDQARIQASNDGVNFTDVWVQPDNNIIIDYNWKLQNIDISAIADGQPTVYLRWVMGPTNGFYNFAGWNIDDVALRGVPNNGGGALWVDFAHTGAQAGTQALPYKSLIGGVMKAAPDQTVRIKGNTADNTSNETLIIRKPVRVEASGGAVRVGSN